MSADPRLLKAATAVQRDTYGNVTADAFTSSFDSTPTTDGTTTLTADSAQVQSFTGTSAQTVVLPSAGVPAGRWFRIINRSTGVLTINVSGGGYVTSFGDASCVVMALQSNPTSSSHWIMLDAALINAGPTQSATPSSIARRDSSGNLLADAFIPGATTTPTAAGTTTLTLNSTEIQVFTGATTQTITLPSANISSGHRYTIINNSTGSLTINSSGSNLVATMPAGHLTVLEANTATPTTAAHWSVGQMINAAFLVAAVASSVAVRDENANLLADAFIPGATTVSVTTTLTVDSPEMIFFTGASGQTITLPTTGIARGQRFTIINVGSATVSVVASDASVVTSIPTSQMATVTATQATPTTSTHWVTAMGANYSYRTTATIASVAIRDNNANLLADNFIASKTATATAAGTTTLTIDSSQVQEFTGSTTQTVKLPTTSVIAGQEYRIINNSSGVVTVQSSGANTIDTVAGGSAKIFLAQVDTPTTAAHWRVFTPSA